MVQIDLLDWMALATFLGCWVGYTLITERSGLATRGLSHAMDIERERWMKTMAERELRMIDTAIMTGLQQGTAFFASACIFAIGGCFALLGSSDMIATIARDLPLRAGLDRPLVELKLLGLVVIFAYAFFKFGWSYRLFNYNSILIGAIPMRAEAQRDPSAAAAALRRAARLNQIAGRHFNVGLRAIFFGLAYLGWFLGPDILMLTTIIVLVILGHRQFFSPARRLFDEQPPA